MSDSEDSPNLQFKRFNMSWIKPDKICVLIGKRATGKSVLTKDLLFHQRTIPVGTVISPSEKLNKFYSDIIPPLFIHDEYSQELITKVLERQTMAVTSKLPNPYAFLILDDCLFDNSWQKSKIMREIFMNGRHYCIMVIITMQYPLGIPPTLRTNIDYVFIGHENITSNRKRIYDHYAGIFPNFDIFCQVLDDFTQDYGFLVIDNTRKSNKLEDLVYWYKAELVQQDFRVGSDKFWKMHVENYNKDKDREHENPDTKHKKKYLHSKKKQNYCSIKKVE
jgi:hypothetical protein